MSWWEFRGLGVFCKSLNMPVKVLGRAYYDIPGITDQNTLAEFWNHPTPPDKELFHAYRMYHLNVTQINGNFYSQVFFLNKNSSDSSPPPKTADERRKTAPKKTSRARPLKQSIS